MAKLKAKGTCSPMPSLRLISTSRSAHEAKAPMAQTVMTCQRPPFISGASPSPYSRLGGAMLIVHGLNTPACEVP